MGNAAATVKPEKPVTSLSNRPSVHLETLNSQKKRVLFVTSEFSDFVKAGGLGDVSSALPKALTAKHDIRVLIPGYRAIMNGNHDIRVVGRMSGHAALPACEVGRIDMDEGLIVYVLICPELYEREGTPYGDEHGRDWSDNHIRFARLGLAAADIAAGTACISWCPELVHVNDWPSALAPAYMSWRGQHTPSVLTIHNLAYQGLFPAECSPELGLPASALSQDGMEFYGKLSFLKAGIAYSSHVTTVSRTYAQEITTDDFGCGLQGMLRSKVEAGLLSGITNGIDDSWEPSTDAHLIEPFDTNDWQGRRANTRYVEQLFGLDREDGPLFAVVSRLVQQKGIDLTLEIAERVVEAGGRMAIIGRGEPALEQALLKLAQAHPGRIGVNVGFNETDARRMFAGSDFLLMPSRFEPCGLSQMYAQRFGSLPIARRTGGLADTIEDGVTGFLFRESTADSYFDAVQRAINVYRHPELLNAMRCKAMSSPLFWDQSVEPYDRLYKSLLKHSARQLPGAVARGQA